MSPPNAHAGDEVSPAESLEFRGLLTSEDAVAIQRCADALIVGRHVQLLARGFAVFIGAVAATVLGFGGVPVASLVLLAISVYVAVLPWERDRLARRNSRRHSSVYRETVVRISAAGLSFENDLLRSELAWTLVGTAADDRAGVLLCNRGGQPICWLPERVLTGDLRGRVLALAASSGVATRRV